jgi:hypothetical protein
MDPSFLKVAQEPHPTRDGSCDLPILYRDASQFGVFFLVDAERARDVLGDKTIEPWPMLGAAVSAIYAWDYRASTVGAYGEVGLGIQARRKGSRPSLLRLARDMGAQEEQGIWVVDLPVSTNGACVAGVDLWGYPKYVTPITTRFDDDGARVALGDELVLSIARLRGPRMRGQPVVTFTNRGGRLVRTVIEVDHRVQWGSGLGAKLQLIGDGPTARSAKRLALDKSRIIATFRADVFRARLPAGVDVGPIA